MLHSVASWDLLAPQEGKGRREGGRVGRGGREGRVGEEKGKEGRVGGREGGWGEERGKEGRVEGGEGEGREGGGKGGWGRIVEVSRPENPDLSWEVVHLNQTKNIYQLAEYL